MAPILLCHWNVETAPSEILSLVGVDILVKGFGTSPEHKFWELPVTLFPVKEFIRITKLVSS